MNESNDLAVYYIYNVKIFKYIELKILLLS